MQNPVMDGAGFVVSERDVAAQRGDGDTATIRVTIDASVGCEWLEQRVLRFSPGRSLPRRLDGIQEVLYAVDGVGILRIDGQEYVLEPETGAFVAAGETWEIDNEGPDELVVVSVGAPATSGIAPERRKATVRLAGQPTLPAGTDREFRYLVNQDSGCLDLTQFVGVISPSRAPLHSHTYDEVVYVLEGEGILHLPDEQTAIGPGSCIHLPPHVMHCLENTGTGPLRVLGVFHPSGDPASHATRAALVG